MNVGNVGINTGNAAPVCYGRNMTFPRQASTYSHRRELPAIVTEGENYRLPGEVRFLLLVNNSVFVYFKLASKNVYTFFFLFQHSSPRTIRVAMDTCQT